MPEVYIFFMGVWDREHPFNSIYNPERRDTFCVIDYSGEPTEVALAAGKEIIYKDCGGS